MTTVNEDKNLKPFYKSNIKIYDKNVLIYDMDEHSDRSQLAKTSFLIEYQTIENEVIVVPKFIAEKLYLTDDTILDSYYITQKNGRKNLLKHALQVRLLTILFIIIFVISVISKITTFLYVAIALFVISLLILLIPIKSRYVSSAFYNFLYVISKKHSKETLLANLYEIITFVKDIEYMSTKNRIKTIKHFNTLISITKKIK